MIQELTHVRRMRRARFWREMRIRAVGAVLITATLVMMALGCAAIAMAISFLCPPAATTDSGTLYPATFQVAETVEGRLFTLPLAPTEEPLAYDITPKTKETNDEPHD